VPKEEREVGGGGGWSSDRHSILRGRGGGTFEFYG
jgi:hypothetical protein